MSTEVETMEGEELDRAVAVEVMGITLGVVDDNDIGAAVFSGFTSNSPHYGYESQTQVYHFGGERVDVEVTGSKWDYKGVSGNDGYGRWLWDKRKGKPWRAAIEAHVAKWKRCIPRYSTHIAAAEPLLDRFADYAMHGCDMGHCCFLYDKKDRKVAEAWGDTRAQAIARCALLAVRSAPRHRTDGEERGT